MTVTLNSYPISQIFGCYRNTTATYYDQNGVLQDSGINTLLVAYDSAKNYKGMTCREQRSNLLTNPRGVGGTIGTIGSGGVYPTNWYLTASGWTTTINGFGVEAGTGKDYVDLTLSNSNPTSVGPYVFYFEHAQIPVVVGTQYTLSGEFKSTAAPVNLASIALSFTELNSSSAVVATTYGPTITPTATIARTQMQRTPIATTVVANLGFRVTLSATGVATSLAMRIYLPQLEVGSFFGTVIRPPAGSLGPAVRGADNILESLQTGALNATTNTVLTECTISQAAPAGQDQGIWRFDDGTDLNKFVVVNVGGGTDVQAQLTIGGTLVATADLGSYVAGGAFRAMAGFDFAAGKIAGLISGGNRATASFTPPGSPPIFTRSLAGRSSLNAGDPVAQSARHLNGHIGRSYLCGGVLDEQSMLYLSQMQSSLGVLLTAAGVTLASS